MKSFCNIEGSTTEQKWRPRYQDFIEISGFLWDFKISQRFQDLTEISQGLTEISLRFCKISLRFQISRSQDFTEISRFHRDFKISLKFYRISLRFCKPLSARSLNFTEIIGKNIAWDFGSQISSKISAQISAVSTCIQDFTRVGGFREPETQAA